MRLDEEGALGPAVRQAPTTHCLDCGRELPPEDRAARVDICDECYAEAEWDESVNLEPIDAEDA